MHLQIKSSSIEGKEINNSSSSETNDRAEVARRVCREHKKNDRVISEGGAGEFSATVIPPQHNILGINSRVLSRLLLSFA